MPRTYKTRDGDWYDVISLREYGTEYFLDKIIDANPGYYDVTRFVDGILLTIPDLPANLAVPNPPWIAVSSS
jgi:phage tail protein X